MSTFYAPTSELYHYGVLGMKWGVRKAAYTSTGLDRKRSKLKKNASKLEKYDKKKQASRDKDVDAFKKNISDANAMLKFYRSRSKMSDQALLKSEYGKHNTFSSKKARNHTIKELRLETTVSIDSFERYKDNAKNNIKRIRKTPLDEFTKE